MRDPKIATKQRILDLLRTGEWELGYSEGSRGNGQFWLQKGGLCKGGDTVTAHGASVNSLERNGLIAIKPREPKQPFWLRRYVVTDQGKTTS